MNKLLIIEDDVTIRNALRILLENQGYFIEEAHDGEEGLQKFDSTFDLLIIDIMMPNISGIEVCRKIREKSYVPILFLTAKSLETDKMEALSAGGDDYLVKPFSYVELIARIQALIRRCRVYDNADASDTTASSTIERCGLTLYTKCNNVSYDGRQLALTDKEYQILLLLISHPTKTFSTQNIFESVWNEPYTQFSNNTRTAKIFVYNNYQEKYLKTLLICDALFTLITAIMILFFISRHILTQIHGALNVVEQSETELINEKNMLIRSMAHDIRTPLAGLQSYAEIIKMENKKGAIPTEHIDVIFNKICEIKGLTDQLFDYSLACNEEALELDAPCNMESAIGDYLSEMAFILREKSFSLDIEKLIWKDFKITVNSNFLGRIFNNITNNICKYADIKAPVCISSIYRSKDAGIEITNHIADKSSLFNTTGMGIRNITLMMKQMNGRAIVSHNNTEFRITLWFSRA